MVACAGCQQAAYLLHVAQGQLGIQGKVEPIEGVLGSGRLSAEEEAKLRLIVAARQFAIDAIGLNAGNSYTTFYDTRGKPLSYNLSASARDALRAQTWTFPIVGTIPYLGFFDLAYAQRTQKSLNDAGYDTLLYEVDAYSTLGYFADPVRSTMLRRSEISLADTIIHEILHNTIWRPDDVDFNESLATFVGRTGGKQFLRSYFGEESELPAEADEQNEDADRVNAFLRGLFDELTDYYAQDIASAEKIAGRGAVFAAAGERFAAEVLPLLHHPERYEGYDELPVNNAWLLANRRYNLDLSLFAAVYAGVGEDWAAALAVYRQAAEAKGNPYDVLRAWLAAAGLP